MRHQLLFVLAVLATIHADNIPELKTSLSFKVLRNVELNVIRPLAELFLSDIAIPIKLNVTKVKSSLNLKKVPVLGDVQVNGSNITIKSVTVDWDNTIFVPYKKSSNQLYIVLEKISIQMVLDLFVKAGSLKLVDSKTTINVQNLTITLLVQFNESSSNTSWGFIPVLQDSTTNVDGIRFHFEKSKIPDLVFNMIARFITPFLPKIAHGLFISTLGPKISNLAATTSLKLALPLPTAQKYQLSISTTQAPFMTYAANDTYLDIAINLDWLNLATGEQSPNFNETGLADRIYQQTQDIELIVGNNLINQLLWFATDSNIIDLYINQNELAQFKSLPISLSTSGLKIIAPQFASTYGENKNMYLGVTTTENQPEIFFRSGRIVGTITLRLAFIVDTDGSNYPQDKQYCTTCIEAHVADLQLYFMASLFTKDDNVVAGNVYHHTHQSMQIMEVRVIDMTYVRGELALDEQGIKETFNSLISAMVPQLNLQVIQGFRNPLVTNKNISQRLDSLDSRSQIW